VALVLGRLDEGLEQAESAGRLAATLGTPRLFLHVCLARGLALRALGRLDEAEEALREALARARQDEAEALVGACQLHLAGLLFERGRCSEAQELGVEATALLSTGEPSTTALAAALLRAWEDLGRLIAADRSAKDLAELERIEGVLRAEIEGHELIELGVRVLLKLLQAQIEPLRTELSQVEMLGD